MCIIPRVTCVSVRWSGELSKFFAIVQIMTLSFPWKNQKFHAVPQSSSLQTFRDASEIMAMARRGRKAQKVFPHWSKSEKRSFCLQTLMWTWITQTCCCIFQNSSSFACSMPQLNTKISGSFFTFRVWICGRQYWVTSFSVRIGLNALKSHIKENHVQNRQKIALGHNKAWEEE